MKTPAIKISAVEQGGRSLAFILLISILQGFDVNVFPADRHFLFAVANSMDLQADESLRIVHVTAFIVDKVCHHVPVDPGLDPAPGRPYAVEVPSIIPEMIVGTGGSIRLRFGRLPPTGSLSVNKTGLSRTHLDLDLRPVNPSAIFLTTQFRPDLNTGIEKLIVESDFECQFEISEGGFAAKEGIGKTAEAVIKLGAEKLAEKVNEKETEKATKREKTIATEKVDIPDPLPKGKKVRP